MNSLYRLIVMIIVFSLSHMTKAAESGETFTIVYNKGIAPLKFTDAENNPSGLLNEYWILISENSGMVFNFIEAGTFEESLEMVKDGRADIHGGLFFTEERNLFLNYTEPIFQLKSYLYSSPDLQPPENLDQARGLLIGTVQTGFSVNELKKNHPEDLIVIYDDFELMIDAALDGEIKVFVCSDFQLNYHLSLKNKENIFSHGKRPFFDQSYYGAVSKENMDLIEEIRKSQSRLDIYDIVALKTKWLYYKAVSSSDPTLESLSEEEISWIKRKRVITLGADSNWPPLDYLDSQGHHRGLSADLLKLIEQRTGLRIEVRGDDWLVIMDQMKNRELDGLTCVIPTEGRKEYLQFSPSYFSAETILLVRKGEDDIRSIDDLKGKKVAVDKDSFVYETLLKEYPHINLFITKSNEESILAVSNFKADAYIGNIAVINYIISQRLLTNLQSVASIPGMSSDLSIAIDKNQPVLFSIIDKAVRSINSEELFQILEKWYLVTTDKKIVLSQQEDIWLENHPVLRVAGDPHWAPISFFDGNGEYSGILPDIFTLIEERSGLNFEYVQTDSWSGTLRLMEEGDLDLIDGIVPSAGRREILDFSETYFSMDMV
ncbi:MAG: transporter substrate-binding domain-containing protein, partial [Spirochaetaceae bacterium]|nr:transporter substrate-binding domain-containing protein [Spirochaetaceae bacterium]